MNVNFPAFRSVYFGNNRATNNTEMDEVLERVAKGRDWYSEKNEGKYGPEVAVELENSMEGKSTGIKPDNEGNKVQEKPCIIKKSWRSNKKD